MWLPLIVCFLVGASRAEYGWKAGTVYDYQIRGRIVGGLHQSSNQYTGMNIRAKLAVQGKTDSVLSVQVQGAQYAHIHANLSDGWTTEIPDSTLQYTPMPIESGPFELHIQNGVVKEMVISKDLPSWDVNFLKGIATALQVDIQGENLKPSRSHVLPTENKPSGVYRTMEESIHGVYETGYDVSVMPNYVAIGNPEAVPLPYLVGNGKFISVVKTLNFSSSNQHMAYHHGLNSGGLWKPGSNSMGNFLTRTSSSRIVLSGNVKSYVIQSTVTDDQVTVAPHFYNTQKGLVASRLNITLKGVTSAEGPPLPVVNPVTVKSLVYEYEPQQQEINAKVASGEEDASKFKYRRSTDWSSSDESDESLGSGEGHYMESDLKDSRAPYLPFFAGYRGQSIQMADRVDVVKTAIEISRDVANDMKSPEAITGRDTLSKFDILTRLLRTMTVTQYQQVFEKLYVSEPGVQQSETLSYKSWLVFRDAVAEAGTGPALITIKEWIVSRIIKGEEAAQLVAVLPDSVQFPSTEYLEELFDMVTNRDVQSQAWLNTSVIMTFSNLVRRSLVSRTSMYSRYPVYVFGPVHRKNDDLLEKYVAHFDKELKLAVDDGNSVRTQAYIRALGNIAHRSILASFEPYLEGDRPATKYQRFLMVAALDKMTKTYTDEVRRVAYRIYQNMGESPEVRTAAVMQIMKSKPSAQMLQGMAQQTNFDHSRQVKAAVKSAIESSARQTPNVYNRQLVEAARSAVDMLTTENFGIHNSRNFIRAYLVKEQNLAYKHHLSYVESSDSILPKAVFYRLKRNMGGFKNSEHEIHFTSSSVDELLQQLSDKVLSHLPREGEEELTMNKSNNSTGWSLKELYKILGFEQEIQEKLEGSILIPVLGANHYVPFDEETIYKYVDELIEAIISALTGRKQSFTKFYNTHSAEIAFATSMGFPFIYSYDTPTVFSLSSQFTGNVEIIRDLKILPNVLRLNSTIDLVYSSKRQGRLGFVTPFNSRVYTAGYEKNLHFHLPLHMRGGLAHRNNMADVIFSLLQKYNDNKLLESSSRAYTTQYNILDMKPVTSQANTKLVQPKPTKTFETTIGKEVGVAFDVKVERQRNPSELLKMFKHMKHHDLISFLLYLDEEDELNNSNVTIVHNSNKSTTDSVTVSVQYQTGTNMTVVNASENKNHQRNIANIFTENIGLISKMSRYRRQKEILQTVMSGYGMAEGHVIDLTVIFNGERKNIITLNAGYGADLGTGNSRCLVYFKNGTLSNEDEFQAVLELDMSYPVVPTVNFKHAMKSDPTSYITGQLDFGVESPLESHIGLEGVLSSSEERRLYICRHPVSGQCLKQMEKGHKMQPACRNVTGRANYLDSYNFTFTYENLPPAFVNATYKVYDALRNYGYGYLEEDFTSGNGVEGQLNMSARFRHNLLRANVSLATPAFSAKFHELPVHEYLRPVLVQHPVYGVHERLGQRLFQAELSPVCVLDRDMLTTFDNNTYVVNLGTKSYVLTQYIYKFESAIHSETNDKNKKYFSVIGRKQPDNKLALEIVTDDGSIEVYPAKGKKGIIKYNGEQVSVKEDLITLVVNDDGKPIFQVKEVPAHAYQIVSVVHQFQVVWTMTGARITVDSNLRGKLKGLCGSLDGEPLNDFVTPKGLIVNDTRSFVSSYSIPPVEGNTVYGYKEVVMLGNVITEVDTGKYYKKEPTNTRNAEFQKKADVEVIETKYKVKMIREAGRTCFSHRPLLTCGHNYKPSRMVEKTVDFHCVPHSSNASKHWEEMVSIGASPTFARKAINHRAKLLLPEKCVEK